MSTEIVDSVIEYSDNVNSMGLIPSRRQVEYTGGYVNNWKTPDFVDYVKSKTSNVIFVRDHGGPGQGLHDDDGINSILCDINSGFDIVHIDPWKTCKTIDEGIEKSINLINYCYKINRNINFEIGTEESIFPYTSEDLNKIIGSMESQLGEKFKKVKYAVIQSGVEISGTKNIGNFSQKRLKAMIGVVNKYNLLSKEHNGDYLSLEKIKERADCGLDSINIAPEFGVMQTRFLLEKGLIKTKDALKECLAANRYQKWIPKNYKNKAPERMIIEVSGHYSFSKKPFKNALKDDHRLEFKKILFERFNEIHSAWSNA